MQLHEDIYKEACARAPAPPAGYRLVVVGETIPAGSPHLVYASIGWSPAIIRSYDVTAGTEYLCNFARAVPVDAARRTPHEDD